MTSSHIFHEIAKAFRVNKVPRKATRDEFLRCFSVIEDGKQRSLDQAFGPILPKGKHVTRSINKPHMRETCLSMIADELLIKRDTSIAEAIEATAKMHRVGINQLEKWWAQGYENVKPDTATSEEILLWHKLHRAKNRYKKTEWKVQPVQRNCAGQVMLSSLRLLPAKKKIPR